MAGQGVECGDVADVRIIRGPGLLAVEVGGEVGRLVTPRVAQPAAVVSFGLRRGKQARVTDQDDLCLRRSLADGRQGFVGECRRELFGLFGSGRSEMPRGGWANFGKDPLNTNLRIGNVTPGGRTPERRETP
jgi:hypothetical protein